MLQKLAFNCCKVYTYTRIIDLGSAMSFYLPYEELGYMKIILLQDVEGLGKAGDLKDVANGYARNYLVPRKLAAGATPALIANRQQRIATEQRKIEKQAEQNRQQAERLGSVVLTFKARVGRQGRLYGSITSQDIAAGLREAEGITIDRRTIDLPSPIRTIGTFMIPVKIAQKVESKITVNVIDEAEKASAAEKEEEEVSEEEEATEEEEEGEEEISET